MLLKRLGMKKKTLEEIQYNIDNARLAINRANDFVLVILEETKRAPYCNAKESDSVFEDLDSANQDIEEALRLLTKEMVKS